MSGTLARRFIPAVPLEDSFTLRTMLSWGSRRGKLSEGVKLLRAAIRQELRSRKAA
jgi:hypothetical protein